MMNGRTWGAVAMMACLAVSGCSGSSGGADNGDAASGASDATGGDDGALGHDGAVDDHNAPDTSSGIDSSASDAGADSSANMDSSATDSSANDSSTLDSQGDVTPPPPDAADAGADCGSIAVLHPAAPGSGPYCPFSTAAPPFATCANGQHCCEPPAGMGTLSTCASNCPGLADGGTDWQCQDPVNCPTGQLCCAIATFDPNPSCSYGLLHGLSATVCATSCAAGQLRVCESDVECPVGTTCRVLKAKGANFGVCQ